MNKAQSERYDRLAHYAWYISGGREGSPHYPQANLRKSFVAGHFLTKEGHVNISRIEKRMRQLGYPPKQGHMAQSSWDWIVEHDTP